MKILLLVAMAVWISGCSTTASLDKISQKGPSTAELMKNTNQSSRSDGLVTQRLANEYNLQGYTRTAENELQVLFPRLPNPTLVMYVNPHLSMSGDPVPGYSTAFPLYDRYEYALPGETAYQATMR